MVLWLHAIYIFSFPASYIVLDVISLFGALLVRVCVYFVIYMLKHWKQNRHKNKIKTKSNNNNNTNVERQQWDRRRLDYHQIAYIIIHFDVFVFYQVIYIYFSITFYFPVAA